MPITEDGNGVIQYTAPIKKSLFDLWGVLTHSDFAIAHPTNHVKQVQFLVNPTSNAKGTLTLQCDVAGDATVNLTSLTAANSFAIMQPITGTSPTASSGNDTLTYSSSDSSVAVAGNSSTKTLDFKTAKLVTSVGITIDGGGGVPTTGYKGYLQVPFACTINSATLLADQAGSVVIDVTKSAFAGYPPTSSITASAKPTLSSAASSTDSTLTGWTTSISAGDVLGFNVQSASTLTRVTLILKVTRTL